MLPSPILEVRPGEPQRPVAQCVDENGRDVPLWKQKVLQKKLDDAWSKELLEAREQDASEARWAGVPAWKRAVLENKEAGVPAPKPPGASLGAGSAEAAPAPSFVKPALRHVSRPAEKQPQFESSGDVLLPPPLKPPSSSSSAHPMLAQARASNNTHPMLRNHHEADTEFSIARVSVRRVGGVEGWRGGVANVCVDIH